MALPYHVLDVFAEAPFGGNPVAVFPQAGDLDAALMQRIALETNLSETTFVTAPKAADGRTPVRIFTPTQELPFAGHPTLGTAWLLRELADATPAEVTLDLGVGPVPVRFEDGLDGELAWLLAPPVTLGATCEPQRVASALGLGPEDIDPRSPVQACAAGIETTLVPLRGRDALARARFDLAAFAPLAEAGFPPFVHLVCCEPRSPENQLRARFFFDALGVREDPATGSATAILGAYLLEHALLGPGPLELRVEQGEEARRPSLLHLRARQDGDGRQIQVGGRVVPVARGELL